MSIWGYFAAFGCSISTNAVSTGLWGMYIRCGFGRVCRKTPQNSAYRIWVPRLLFFLKQDLYPINVLRSLLIKSALRGTGTSRYKCPINLLRSLLIKRATNGVNLVLYPINFRSLLIKSALRGTGTSRYKWG